MSTTDHEKPQFLVVKGSPTEDELEAVRTVLTTLWARRRQEEATPAQSGWSAYWRSVRSPIQPGPSAWRMSGRPQ
jgi:Acyl-CoA carboxylase epsilon subunit